MGKKATKTVVKYDTESAHQSYKLASGVRVPGASTIAKLCDDNTSQLMGWAWRLGCEGKDYRKVRDNAATLGSCAHFMIECYLKGQEPDLDSIPKDLQDKATVAFDKFKGWWSYGSYKLLSSEAQMVSEAHRFGGTADIVAVDPSGDVHLVDIKTSSGIYLSYRCQLAAYRQLCDENRATAGIPEGKQVAQCHIVRVGKEDPDDFEVRHYGRLDKEFDLFRAALNLYYARKEVR